MKLTSALLFAVLLVLSAFSASTAKATSVVIKAPDPSCANAGDITIPVITIASGGCTDFTWEGSNPLGALAIIVTSVQPPLSCSIASETSQAFNECVVVIPDLTAALTPTEITILEYAIGLIPGLSSGQVAGLDTAVSDLVVGDGLLVAACDTQLSTPCSNLAVGATGDANAPEPATLLLLGLGMGLLFFAGWNYKKHAGPSEPATYGGLAA